MSKTYRGSADASPKRCVTVRAAGQQAYTVLGLRLDLANHSPTGFGWGYAGSGPAQLALAVLADATGDDQLARRLHQEFKHERIARLPMDRDWIMSQSEILGWVGVQREVA